MRDAHAGNRSAPLSRVRAPFCLHAMPNNRLPHALQVGILAGATTAGSLVGLGVRHGAASAPFEILGRAFTARFAGILLGASAATVIGVAIHLMWMLLWGLCFAL